MTPEPILRCLCGNERELPPFEMFLPVKSETTVFCCVCRKMVKHTVAMPGKKEEPRA